MKCFSLNFELNTTVANCSLIIFCVKFQMSGRDVTVARSLFGRMCDPRHLASASSVEHCGVHALDATANQQDTVHIKAA
jgi:hypothetical protein